MHVSYLYTPALRFDSLIANRRSLIADAVVVDIEDSIHINAKADARAKVATIDVSPLVELGVRVGLRMNSLASPEGLKDMDVLLRLGAERGRLPFEFVLVPKVGHANDVKMYRSLFNTLREPPELYPFIETVQAVENADGIAAVSDGLAFGQADLIAELYSPNENYINHARAQMCVAAAKYKLQAIDTNSFEIEDLTRFEAECVAAKGYGFTAKAAIHPRQVPAINSVFSVTPATIAKYQKLIETYQRSDVGFVLVDGQAVAPPFVAKARRMLELYDRYQKHVQKKHGKEAS
ncbi:HpcH/HpaI aldolase/citrate lyase family protein [Pendulispora albinea]|uniref:CoA ester lyase n=1 Tax=Pendulispora albinea TaxID=2741071 RepID=A0ABZ2M1R7_9BACT